MKITMGKIHHGSTTYDKKPTKWSHSACAVYPDGRKVMVPYEEADAVREIERQKKRVERMVTDTPAAIAGRWFARILVAAFFAYLAWLNFK